ncbi:MAG: hypothetical protein WCQ49_02265 [Candidatus Saccharibacteria bacterium]
MKEKLTLKIRKFRVKAFRIYFNLFFNLGLYTRSIKYYEQPLIERLRLLYYGGVPYSIILMIQRLCNGICYDRASMLSLGLEEFNLVWGSIMGVRYNKSTIENGYQDSEHSDHCWVESGGWVYDTSHCIKYRKWLYYLIERPIIRRRRDQDWCKCQPYYQEMIRDSSNCEEGFLPLIVPLIEPHVKKSIYGNKLESEFELFLSRINYSQIHDEVNADMVRKGIKVE